MHQTMGFDPETQYTLVLDQTERKFRRASVVREARGSRKLRSAPADTWLTHAFAQVRARFQPPFPEHQIEPVPATTPSD